MKTLFETSSKNLLNKGIKDGTSLSDNNGNIGDRYRLQGIPACVNVFIASNRALAEGAQGSSFLSNLALIGVMVKFTAARFRFANEERTSESLTAKSDLVTMKTG